MRVRGSSSRFSGGVPKVSAVSALRSEGSDIGAELATDASVDLLFYTTLGCHLCDEAEQLLVSVAAQRELVLAVEAVEIASSSALVDRYGLRIPVLHRVFDGEELGWPFDAERLFVFLEGIVA